MKSFEESIAWQRGMDLNVAVDKALANSRNFGFKDQLFRASLSICNNIAEGHEMPTVRNQLRYLWIAKGSCNEVHSMHILAQRREYFPPDVVREMLSLQDEIARLLRTYIKKTSSGWDKIPGGLLLLGLWIKFTDPMVLP
jgi:four helix bundle protein